ncbi:UNVERIFIED_CONTAM: hypothetical protein Sradi_6995400 [Sesamum radiatum]|uniref:Uncharacterized protein n=1 Tax=Sesamum radiatum TaxID=300843 RepID=A0AAW2JD65_SESRA
MHSPSSSSNLVNGIPNSENWKFVWNRAVPRKTMMFCWKVCHNALPTLSNLARRKVDVCNFCPVCSKEDETLSHVLSECNFARQIWALSHLPHQILSAPHQNCAEWIKNCCKSLLSPEANLFVTICWNIWNHRNKCLMESSRSHPMEILSQAIIHLSEFTNCQESLTVTQHRTRISQWYPPPTDTIKVNFDGAHLRELSSTGIGVVARNSEGVLLAWRRKHLSFPTAPDHAEILAAKEAMEFAREKGWRSVIIEGDCLSIIIKLKDVEDDYSPLGPISEHVKALAVAFQSLTYVHVHRLANTLAHELARFAHFSDEGVDLVL